MRKFSLVLAAMLTGGMGFCQQVQKVSPAGTKFHLYTPPGYDPSDGTYPLLVVLHGQGGMGDNLNLLLTHKDQIPSKLIYQNKWPARYPFIVVTPLLNRDESVPDPADQVWPPTLVDEVVEYVRSTYAVNKNKIYVTGLSLGGHGSYSYAAAYPDKVAAVVMISGVPDSLIACQAKDVPIWAFHGSDDWLVDLAFPRGMVRSINACSPPGKFHPQLTILQAKKHEGWNEIYNNSSGYNVYDWMLKFTKNDPSNTAPYVNAGNDLTILRRDEALHLYGEFFDSDGRIANVTWTQVSGPSAALDDVHSKLLKVSNLTAGEYEFELRVLDDDGAQSSDRVQVHILSNNGSLPAISGLTLINARTDNEVSSLKDGFVINPESMGTNQINIRASATGSPGSVRFRINSDQNTKTLDSNPYLVGNRRWTLEKGEYLVCATPFTGAGATGNPGVSQCYKIIVSTEQTQTPPVDATPPEPEPEPPPATEPPDSTIAEPNPQPPPKTEPPPVAPPSAEVANHFFAKEGMDISLLNAWSSNADGTGTPPTSFSADGQTFDIPTRSVLNNPLTIGGTGTEFRILDGGALTLNQRLSCTINMEGHAMLNVNTGDALTLGALSPLSVIDLNASATAIPRANYGHLNLKGGGSIKMLSPDTIRIAGNLTIEDGVKVEGAAGAKSVLKVSGDVTLAAEGSFLPVHTFSLVFDKGTFQKFNVMSTRVIFHAIVVAKQTILQFPGSQTLQALELGSDSGGGLTIEDGAKFLMKGALLTVKGMGTVNAGNEKGEIGFQKSAIEIFSGAITPSHLYTVAGSDSVQTITTNLTGTAPLILERPLYVADEVNVINGTINSNGNLVLVSTSSGTAHVRSGNGKGKVTGDVVFQRFIPRGKQRRLISLPVSGATVSQIQQHVPVTGKFNGASTGEGLSADPSLFYFDETKNGWVGFPESANTEAFEPGRGYSMLIMDGKRDSKVIAKGPLYQKDFEYNLTPNVGNDPDKGWNLVGNPFAVPIQWDEETRVSEQTSSAAYVLDDRYPGGRFLVWDGKVGDREFGGLVAQGQSFFVRTTGGAPFLRILEGAKTDTSANMWREKKTEAVFDHLVVTLERNDLTDKAYIAFSEEAENNFDRSDAVKRKNGYFSLSTLSSDSVKLAINYLRESFCDRSVTLGLEGTAPGDYTLTFDGAGSGLSNAEINLIDHFAGKVVGVHAGSSYDFQITNAAASEGKKRFILQILSSTQEDPMISVSENVLTSNASAGNQWLLNGKRIEGATGSTYVALDSGEYRVEVTADGCTKVSAPVYITLTVTATGETRNVDLIFYPNPASEFIRFELGDGSQVPLFYSITNTSGMQVASGTLEGGGLAKSTMIDVGKFPAGVYFLHVRTIGGDYRTKFIINGRKP